MTEHRECPHAELVHAFYWKEAGCQMATCTICLSTVQVTAERKVVDHPANDSTDVLELRRRA